MAVKVGNVVVNFKTNLAAFESDIKQATRSLGRMSRDFGNAGRALTMGFSVPIAGAGIAAIKLAGDFEQTKIAFNTMLGSTEKSTKFLKELRDFAAKTPFEFKDLTNASKRMMALGFTSEQVLPTLKNIGDAVAGLGGGSEMIDRVTLALGQMQAKGKVSAQEMNQLAEAGIPAWKALADNIGKSIPEAMKLAEKGAISSSIAIPAILEGMNQKFGGLMSKQNQTLLGQFSNLKDQLYFIVMDLGATLMPMATKIMDSFIKPLAEQIKGLVDWFSSLSKENQELIIKTVALTAAIGPLVWAFGTMASSMSSVLAMSTRLISILSGGEGLIVAIKNLGAAAVVTGAAFAGWKIAEWADSLDLFGRHAKVAANEIIRQAEGYKKQAIEIGAVKEAMAKYQDMVDKGIITQNTFNGILNDLTKQRGSETLEQYRDRMKGLVDQFKSAHPEIAKVGEAASASAPAVATLSEEMLKLRASVQDALYPMNEMSGKIKAQASLGFESSKLINLYSDQIINAAHTQRQLGGSLSDSQLELLAQAIGFKDLKDRIYDAKLQLDEYTHSIDKIEMPDLPELPDAGIKFGLSGDVADVYDAMQQSLKDKLQNMQPFLQTPDEEQLAIFQGYYNDLDELRANSLISEQEYAEAKKQIAADEVSYKLSAHRNYYGNLSNLQSSNIRALAAIGKAAAIAEATINTYVGATKALAQGGIWGSINMAAVMAVGFAQVAAISAQGFAKGGIVPGGEQLIKVNEQGSEFVMNSKATKEYLPLLQMMNNPAPINNRLEASPVASALAPRAVNVSIANYGTSKQFEVQQLDEGNIRIIARDEAMRTLSSKGPEIIANDMAYANSRTSKAIARHTTARRADR